MQDAVETAFGALEVVERGDGRIALLAAGIPPRGAAGALLDPGGGGLGLGGRCHKAQRPALPRRTPGCAGRQAHRPVAPPFRDRALRARMRAATRGGENAGPETQAYRIDRARAQRAVAPPASAPRRPVVKGGPHGA